MAFTIAPYSQVCIAKLFNAGSVVNRSIFLRILVIDVHKNNLKKTLQKNDFYATIMNVFGCITPLS